MAGGIILGIVMVIVIPAGTMLVGAIWSALMGWSLVDEGEVHATTAGPTPSA